MTVPRRSLTRNLTTLTVAAFALAFVASAPGVAEARKSKSTQNEAQWIAFDPAAKTITVKITKKGKGPNKDLLKPRKEATFNVIPEGSVLTRTTVKINGMKAELQDIPEGKTVLIYWIPDESKEGELFARSINAIMSDDEFDAKYGTDE
jgi:hypothetical protein